MDEAVEIVTATEPEIIATVKTMKYLQKFLNICKTKICDRCRSRIKRKENKLLLHMIHNQNVPKS